jgi:tellurite resistance protein TehA-like permease
MGFLLSLPIDAIYLWRLFTIGLPEANRSPAMMIAVGPPTFFPLAFLKMAAAVPKEYGAFGIIPDAVEIVQVLALVMAIAIIGLGFFFFLMAFARITYKAKQMTFHLTWYGFMYVVEPLVILNSSLLTVFVPDSPMLAYSRSSAFFLSRSPAMD